MRMLSRMIVSATFLAAVTLLAGCGSDLPELGTVTGIVTLDDKPLADATVVFEPENDRFSQGFTDAEGRYELMYKVGVAGAALGKHTVRITKFEGGGEGEEEDDPAGADGEEAKSIVPAAYNTQTTLTEEVKSGSQEIDFKLSSSAEAPEEEEE